MRFLTDALMIAVYVLVCFAIGEVWGVEVFALAVVGIPVAYGGLNMLGGRAHRALQRHRAVAFLTGHLDER